MNNGFLNSVQNENPGIQSSMKNAEIERKIKEAKRESRKLPTTLCVNCQVEIESLEILEGPYFHRVCPKCKFDGRI